MDGIPNAPDRLRKRERAPMLLQALQDCQVSYLKRILANGEVILSPYSQLSCEAKYKIKGDGHWMHYVNLATPDVEKRTRSFTFLLLLFLRIPSKRVGCTFLLPSFRCSSHPLHLQTPLRSAESSGKGERSSRDKKLWATRLGNCTGTKVKSSL